MSVPDSADDRSDVHYIMGVVAEACDYFDADAHGLSKALLEGLLLLYGDPRKGKPFEVMQAYSESDAADCTRTSTPVASPASPDQ